MTEPTPQELWEKCKAGGWIETVVRTNYGTFRPDGLALKLLDALIDNKPPRRARTAYKLWRTLDYIAFQHAEAVTKAEYEADDHFDINGRDADGKPAP